MLHKHEAYENEKEYRFQQPNQLKVHSKGTGYGLVVRPW
jgi:hypothetical protein